MPAGWTGSPEPQLVAEPRNDFCPKGAEDKYALDEEGAVTDRLAASFR
jgi:hypothetical protein